MSVKWSSCSFRKRCLNLGACSFKWEKSAHWGGVSPFSWSSPFSQVYHLTWFTQWFMHWAISFIVDLCIIHASLEPACTWAIPYFSCEPQNTCTLPMKNNTPVLFLSPYHSLTVCFCCHHSALIDRGLFPSPSLELNWEVEWRSRLLGLWLWRGGLLSTWNEEAGW